MSPTIVSAATLLDIVNVPVQTDTPYGLTFTANASTSTVSFAGYHRPSVFTVQSIGLFLNDAGPSIISGNGNNFALTRAPSGSGASSFPGGLQFFGATVGNYDSFSQVASTIAGASYTLRFNLSNSTSSQQSGFRVEATNASIGAVPEPATWAMMLVGFGLIGATTRYRRTGAQVRYA